MQDRAGGQLTAVRPFKWFFGALRKDGPRFRYREEEVCDRSSDLRRFVRHHWKPVTAGSLCTA